MPKEKLESGASVNIMVAADRSLRLTMVVVTACSHLYLSCPQAEDLLKRMLAIDGPKSVAQDTATRQKIACFPPEIHDPELLSEIKGNV